jgi:hypothetical protein
MKVLRIRSDRVRPVGTAERAIGRERKRSSMPSARSSLSPYAVGAEPKTADWARMPGMCQYTYSPWAAGGRAAWLLRRRRRGT